MNTYTLIILSLLCVQTLNTAQRAWPAHIQAKIQEEINASLVKSIEENNLDAVMYDLKEGADVNARFLFNNTPLIIAAYHGNPKIIQTLIDHGADINAQRNQKSTALHVALAHHKFDAFKLLIENGADYFIPNKNNQTVFDLVSANKNSNVPTRLYQDLLHFKPQVNKTLTQIKQESLFNATLYQLYIWYIQGKKELLEHLIFNLDNYAQPVQTKIQTLFSKHFLDQVKKNAGIITTKYIPLQATNLSLHYQTLGLTPNASWADIKNAYKRLVLQYHPDKGGDSKKFNELQQAYEALRNIYQDESIHTNLHKVSQN